VSGSSPATRAIVSTGGARPRPAMKTMMSIASAISRRGTVTTASWTSCSIR
jgi:hypothetical protein